MIRILANEDESEERRSKRESGQSAFSISPYEMECDSVSTFLKRQTAVGIHFKDNRLTLVHLHCADIN